MASEELEHAQEFMKIQRQRGGNVVLKEIPPPKKQAWSSGESGLWGRRVTVSVLHFFLHVTP